MHLAQKLRIKEGMRLHVYGAPEGYADLLVPLPAGAEVTSEKAEKGIASLQIFIRDLLELQSLSADLLDVCGKSGMLWITYPKITSRSTHGLSRDLVRDALRKLGWRAVTIVAVNDTWAALRFKQIERGSVPTDRGSQS